MNRSNTKSQLLFYVIKNVKKLIGRKYAGISIHYGVVIFSSMAMESMNTPPNDTWLHNAILIIEMLWLSG